MLFSICLTEANLAYVIHCGLVEVGFLILMIFIYLKDDLVVFKKSKKLSKVLRQDKKIQLNFILLQIITRCRFGIKSLALPLAWLFQPVIVALDIPTRLSHAIGYSAVG